jgi:hypothetical protein
MGEPAIPKINGIQLDIATIAVRLEQVKRDNRTGCVNAHWLMEKIFDCDLPRLYSHLNSAALAQVKEIGAISGWETPEVAESEQ